MAIPAMAATTIQRLRASACALKGVGSAETCRSGIGMTAGGADSGENEGECIHFSSSSVKANTRARELPGKRWTGSDLSFSQRLTVRSSRLKKAAISFQESSRRFGVSSFRTGGTARNVT